MVTVDMSTARAQITKRQRRMRRAVQRRLQKQQKAQLREHRAVEAARQARQRAIARWNAEEDRLQRLRDHHIKPSHSPNLTSPASRAVKFAQNVMVTEIPVVDAHKLPKPVTSPIGVSICGTDDSDDDSILSTSKTSNALPFTPLSEADFVDDDEDPDFTPDEPVKVNMRKKPIERPRRRIIVKRLDVPLDEIISDKPSSKPKLNNPPKRPRSETSVPLQSSATGNGMHEDGHLHSKPPLELGSTTKTHESSKRKLAPDAGSSPDRSKSKRRRMHNRNGESPCGEKRKAAGHAGHSNEIIGANGVDNTVDALDALQGHKKEVKANSKEEPSSETQRANSVLLISSTKKNGRKKRTSQQISTPKDKSKKCEKQSASAATRDSPRKKSKSNGLHTTIPDLDQQDKPSESEDDQDLDNMFGNLVRMKAANRALHEKKTKLEKVSQNGEESNSLSSPRTKPNTRKSPSRFTEDGLRIMTYEEIAADQPAGLNGDCPFDCSCCF